jgi:hypothetical protein
MTKSEFNKACKIAFDKNVSFVDENGNMNEDISVFDGFGLSDFQPITVSLRCLAALIRWQCLCFNGNINQDELNNIAIIGKKKFTVVGV